MHTYFRAIGFSNIKKGKEMDNLFGEVITNYNFKSELGTVLEALLDTIYALMCDMGDSSDIDDRPHHTLVLSYIDRTDILDSQHTIAQVELNGGAELHRFKNNAGVDYSAIYVGDNKMIHSTHPGEGVLVSNIDYWKRGSGTSIVGIRRVG